nr:hypothetical protein [uncultured Desulfobacter sp.]
MFDFKVDGQTSKPLFPEEFRKELGKFIKPLAGSEQGREFKPDLSSDQGIANTLNTMYSLVPPGVGSYGVGPN